MRLDQAIIATDQALITPRPREVIGGALRAARRWGLIRGGACHSPPASLARSR